MNSTSFGSGFKGINASQTHQMKLRRVHRCKGACGKPLCAYETIETWGFKRHVNRVKRTKKYICNHCSESVFHLSKHIRRHHPEYAKKIRKIYRCPFEDKNGFRFIKNMVARNIYDDIHRSHKWSASDEEDLRSIHNNHSTFKIAVEVYKRWSSMHVFDDAGGFLPNGLLLRSHSLHQLSHDRINNDRPHYILGGTLSNVAFIISGMNTSANIVCYFGKKTRDFLHQRKSMPIQEKNQLKILERERSPTNSNYKNKSNKGKANVVYASISKAYDRDGKIYFKSRTEMVKYGYNLFVEQGAICEISGYLMDCHVGSELRFFMPSLDAIDPLLGHRPGNLRWVCRFLNSTNAKYKNTFQDGTPVEWTQRLFNQYIRYEGDEFVINRELNREKFKQFLIQSSL